MRWRENEGEGGGEARKKNQLIALNNAKKALDMND